MRKNDFKGVARSGAIAERHASPSGALAERVRWTREALADRGQRNVPETLGEGRADGGRIVDGVGAVGLGAMGEGWTMGGYGAFFWLYGDMWATVGQWR